MLNENAISIPKWATAVPGVCVKVDLQNLAWITSAKQLAYFTK